MSSWPRIVKDEDAGKEKVRVEVECDDALVIHVVAAGENQELGKLGVGGVSVSASGEIECEAWIYLTLEEARALVAAAAEVVSILEDTEPPLALNPEERCQVEGCPYVGSESARIRFAHPSVGESEGELRLCSRHSRDVFEPTLSGLSIDLDAPEASA